MKIIATLIIFLLISSLSNCFSQKLSKHTSELLEHGEYQKVINLLEIRAKEDYTKKNWVNWIFKKKNIGDCYSKLYIQDSLFSIVREVEKIIHQKKIKNPSSLSEFHEMKCKAYFLKEDMDAGFQEIQKSYSLKIESKHDSDIELFPTHLIYLSYYIYARDPVNSLIYANKLIPILNQYKNKLSKNRISEAYNQISYAIKIQAYNNDPEVYWKMYEKSRSYNYLALKAAKNNPILAAQAYHYIAASYFRNLYETRENGWPFNKQFLLNKANYFFDKSISINKKVGGENSFLLAKTYFLKGQMYENYSSSKTLHLYNKTLNTTIENWHTIKTEIDTPNSPSIVVNTPFALMTLRHRALILLKIYEETASLNYLKAAFKTLDYASKLSTEMLNNFDSSSPYQILNIHGVLPFQKAIHVSFLLYEKTKNKYYKTKLFEYSENNKYSDIIKGYLLSKTENRKKNEIAPTFILKNKSVKDIQQKKIKESNCIIEYTYDSEGSLFGILLTKKKIEVIKLDTNSIVLDNKITQLKTAIENSDFINYKNNATELYQLLFKPFEKEISKKIKELIIIPDKMLSFVPFDALLTKVTPESAKDYRSLPYLINKYQLSEQLSLTIENYLASKPSKKTSIKLLGVAPGEIRGMSNLPFSLKSLNYFKDNYSGVFLIDTAATKKNLKRHISNSSILFLASHANGNISNSNDSKIYLHNPSDDKSKRSYIQLKDIYNLQLNSDIVILSACETSLGEYQSGEGIINFERAFVFAGSKSVLSTLWKTDDMASYQILTTFIDEIYQNKSNFDALHSSKKHFLSIAKSSDDANPLYWAGFKLSGVDDSIEMTRNNILMYILAGFLGLTFLTLFLFLRKRRKNRLKLI